MNLIVFDTETTGLTLHPDAKLALQPRIIEIGAVLCCDGVARESLSQLINPQTHIEDEITNITGLSNADVADAPLFADYLPTLRDFFAKADLVVGHNLLFDRDMLEYELRRHGQTLADFPWPKKELCTVGVFREEFGKQPTLKALHEHVLGRPLAQTHRALDDANALLEIVLATGNSTPNRGRKPAASRLRSHLTCPQVPPSTMAAAGASIC